MKQLKVNYQKSSDKFWTDEAGNQTQYNRLFPHEKLQEHSSFKLHTRAMRLNEELRKFKEEMEDICMEVYEQFLQDNKLDSDKRKGNFTWYNFDRSIKVEVSIQERITFDEMGISAVKSLLDDFLDKNIDSKVQIVKEMVTDAFSTSNGRLDARKVMNLLRYEGKIKDADFTKAMTLLREAIRRPDSKTYFRIWGRLEDGSYENVELNFSKL